MVQVNRFGLVPKAHQPDKWRLIEDLSFSRGNSVKGSSPRSAACRRVVAYGRGAILAKFDVMGAFRTIPVHPEERWLLGMRWNGIIYVDKVLLFGLRSAPKLYNAVADAMLWVLMKTGPLKGSSQLHHATHMLQVANKGQQLCLSAALSVFPLPDLPTEMLHLLFGQTRRQGQRCPTQFGAGTFSLRESHGDSQANTSL